jgi:hypothetical protein
MFTSLFIIGMSIVMFCYWFRYTCLLLLQTKPTRDLALSVITEKGLQYRAIQAGAPNLEAVDALLQRDYQLLQALMRRCSAGYDPEALVLRAYFIITRTQWRVTRRIAPSFAARAVQEMISVLDNWATVVAVAQQQAHVSH